jgi:enediyne polyketide synthase
MFSIFFEISVHQDFNDFERILTEKFCASRIFQAKSLFWLVFMNISASSPIQIAVVGMGCWYPGSSTLKDFWENVVARKQQFRQTPNKRLPLDDYYDSDPTVPDKTYGNRMSVIDGFEFDWVKRRIPKSVVESADIAHWIALEVAIKAVEDAGYTRGNIPNERTGVLLGNTLTGEFSRSTNLRMRWPYVRRTLIASAKASGLPLAVLEPLVKTVETHYKSVFSPITEDTLSGNLSNTIAGRICNFFDFHGGGYTLDGACASSLIAVANAANSLSSGELDLALAGGVDISLDTFELIGFAKTNALTGTDMTVYDRNASGFIPGEGCGFVVLKRLADARANGDYVYAVLNGWGISSDGKGGLTAPSSQGQATALKRAYERAGYSPHTLDFIEGHGTGTVVGDRTELEGIALALNAYGEASSRGCGVTSFKSLVGHTKAAAGIGALIKTVMAVNRRVLPAVAGCKKPNAVFEGIASGLYPIQQGEVRDPESILRAGVSAMGFGGINCHITLESSDAPAPHLTPSIEEQALLVSSQETEIFVFTAKSIPVLLEQVQALRATVSSLSLSELVDLSAYLAHDLDSSLSVRGVVIAAKPLELLDRLALLESRLSDQPPAVGEVWSDAHSHIWIGNTVQPKRIGFLFPGQGSQRLNMGRVLVERHAWARELVEQAEEWLNALGCPSVSDRIFMPIDRAVNSQQVLEWSEALAQTEVASPAICLTSLLWLEYLDRLGIQPTAVGGHSLGELTAFCCAGAFDKKALISLAALRGQAMSSMAAMSEPGAMASFECSEGVAAQILHSVTGYVVIANINSPTQTVISGEKDAIQEAIEQAKQHGVQARLLPVSNGFHSRLIAPAADVIRKLDIIPEYLESLQVNLFSSTDGQAIKTSSPLREHFAQQIVGQVNFNALMHSMAQVCDLFIEVGSGQVLSGLVSQMQVPSEIACFPIESKAGVDQDFNKMLAALFVHNQSIRWNEVYEKRLVRPFVPVSERAFIENPVEQPFNVSPESVDFIPGAMSMSSPQHFQSSNSAVPFSHRQSPVPDAPHLISSPPQPPVPPVSSAPQGYVSWDELFDYVAQRNRFLAEVIRADLQTSPYLPKNHPSPNFGYPQSNGHIPVQSNGHPTTQNNGYKIANDSISKGDGFPLTDYAHSSRHAFLNIRDTPDNYAAAEVNTPVGYIPNSGASTSQAAGVPPVYQSTETHISSSSNVETALIDIIMEKTGFPKESITLATRLLDDLNLDSIKAGEIISVVAQAYGVAGQVDPASLANATIQEISDVIQIETSGSEKSENFLVPVALPTFVDDTSHMSVSDQEQPISQHKRINGPLTNVPSESRPTRVRDYIIQTVAEDVTPVSFDRHEEEEWSKASVVILSESRDASFAKTLQDELCGEGARVKILSFDEVDEQAVTELNPEMSHFIAVLPQTPDDATSSDDLLTRMIRRLRSVAIPMPAAQTPHRHITVAYIQSGGGHFGTKPPFSRVEQCCSIGFASSLHLERPDLKVRVIDFANDILHSEAVKLAVKELTTPHSYLAVGYDKNSIRYVPSPKVQEPIEYQDRQIEWSSSDVILVTGGTKGITAECAIALAKDTGVKMALVGRSPIPDRSTSQSSRSEITRTTDRFSAHGLVCRAYSCDVTDLEALNALVRQITKDLGKVTGVIHGAAINRPRLISQSSVEEALDEVKPKLKGLLNLCQVFEQIPLKLFAGFSSVIGVTGMQRNAWYGFANESLDLILRRYQKTHPGTAVVSTAYSVWEEVGMGARMGSVRSLAKMGISAIPKDEGAARFLNLIKNSPTDLRVVVTAPMQSLSAFESAGLDTWLSKKCSPPDDLKFLERVILWEENVEILARAHLSLEKDAYLRDHCYEGSYLFPTVFGLEAMAQAVAYITGNESLPTLRIENIRLERPIVVSADKELEIEIHAEVLERRLKNAPKHVDVSIRSEATGFSVNHFSATFVVGADSEISSESIALPDTPLDISPKRDLYTWLLFQGSRFQSLKSIYELSSQNCTFEVQRNFSFPSDVQRDSARMQSSFLLGDPYYRDALLQAGQLMIPQDKCLPVEIGCIEIDQPRENHQQQHSCIGITVSKGKEGKRFSNTVLAVTSDGQVVERLSKYQVQMLAHRSEYPTSEELADPQLKDETMLQREIDNRTRRFNVTTPKISLNYVPRLGNLPSKKRHEIEVAFFHSAVGQLVGDEVDLTSLTQISWTDSGKPKIALLENINKQIASLLEPIELSLSHDEQVCLCTAGQEKQGCDIEPVIFRSTSAWQALLGNIRQPLLDALRSCNDPINYAGIRIWTAIEALKKATGLEDTGLDIHKVDGDNVLFADISNPSLKVLTFPVRLTRRNEKMIALVVQDLVPTEAGVSS